MKFQLEQQFSIKLSYTKVWEGRQHAVEGLHVGTKAGAGKSRPDRHRVPCIPSVYQIFGMKQEQENNRDKPAKAGPGSVFTDLVFCQDFPISPLREIPVFTIQVSTGAFHR
jgi:hypothetical protein